MLLYNIEPKNDNLLPFILPLVIIIIIAVVYFVLKDFDKISQDDKDNMMLP